MAVNIHETVPKLLTYDDYLLLPNDRNRYEILEGVLNMTPAPTPKHQDISRNLLIRLTQYVEAKDVGKVYAAPIDVVLDPVNVVQPDLIFITKERLGIVTEKNILGVPDLIIEIVSPSTLEIDREEKFQIYAKHEVAHYWLVDPKEQVIEVYTLRDSGYELVEKAGAGARFEPSMFPGLMINLKEIWE